MKKEEAAEKHAYQQVPNPHNNVSEYYTTGNKWDDAKCNFIDGWDAHAAQTSEASGVEQAAKEFADRLHPFIWPKNKHGEDMVQVVGAKAPPFSKKHRKEQQKLIQSFIAGADWQASQPSNTKGGWIDAPATPSMQEIEVRNPKTWPPERYGKYWCIIEGIPKALGMKLTILDYGGGEDGNVGFLSEDGGFKVLYYLVGGFNPSPIPVKDGDLPEFLEYADESREEFVKFIWDNFSDSVVTRVAAESFLICFDQMRARLKPLSGTTPTTTPTPIKESIESKKLSQSASNQNPSQDRSQ